VRRVVSTTVPSRSADESKRDALSTEEEGMALSLDEASVDWETFRKEGKQMVDFIANYYQVG